MAREKVRVAGLSDLEEALRELPKATAKNVLLRTLKESGKPIAADGEARAPKLTGKLAQSYTVGTKLSRRQKKLHKKESPVEIFVGPTPHAKSVQTEFGNAHQAAEPHLRPAWDANAKPALDGIAKTLENEIGKAVKRLARKAEREAAKMRASM